MHKRTHLKVSDTQAAPRAAKRTRGPKPRANRKRRNWNRTFQGVAALLAVFDLALLAFAPGLHVTRVRVVGAETLTPSQVFDEASVPAHTNLFWMLRQPLAKRLEADPVVDHAERSVRPPNLLILTVTERRPYAVLVSHQEGAQQCWLLDHQGVPYRTLDTRADVPKLNPPKPNLPVIDVAEAALPGAAVTLGRPLKTSWLPDAFRLLALTRADPGLDGAKIAIDQNLNLCLNRKDTPQIRLGQSDSLPRKMALADAALSAYGGALSQRAAYIDVSCPQQPVWRPRTAGKPKPATDLRSD